jgi:hypothetical protein
LMTSGSLNYLTALVEYCTSMQWLEKNADAGMLLTAPE